MTRTDLIWKIEHGDDIMFDLQNRHFVILTWPEEGIVIGEAIPGDNHDEVFSTAEELVDTFTVDGHSLADLAHEIEITE